MYDSGHATPWPSANSIHQTLADLVDTLDTGYVSLNQIIPLCSSEFPKLIDKNPNTTIETGTGAIYNQSLTAVELLESLLKYDSNNQFFD